MLREFREFVNRGNLVDLAVAFVMGVAFASVTASLTEDIVNPLLGKVLAVDSLGDWTVAGVGIGAFLVAVINFLIVAFLMFLVVKAYNRTRRKGEAAPGPPPEEVVLLREIRDSLSRR